ncbi:MAG: glycosyl transferase family 2 [Sphingomonas bacterium]|uniref:glycosyltransferase family 2 protein n=1 Tax=Sphingomonas bacterium TaxID=1895847 RepID=UPI00263841D2|nr:glycosyltransferase family A protein [Sphingomonas bacterium]MDB5703307.1 glycosyl transferase family 2 [Sphingomonas bacterium]
MSTPAISVIMAAYNGAGLIVETLESLKAQSFTDFEVIIVDDCSTDDTLAVARGFGDPRIRVIAAETNQGVVASRNRAVAEARGRYIAALDHDDLCHPDRFARQVAYLDEHPDTVLVGTAAAILENGVLLPGSLAPVSTPMLIEWLLRIENPLVWSSVMMRGDAARQLDPFTRPDMVFAEDFDLYHRIGKLGTIARLDDELMTYRRHTGSASQRHVDAMTGRATDVLEAAYVAVFGPEAQAIADLIVRHVMGRRPVPDRDTFRRVGDALVTLQDDFLETRRPDPQSRSLIRWETARRWARIGRIGLRTGQLDLSDAVAVRPDHLGLGYAGIDDLIMSRLVGGARAIQRRLADRKAS